jgi:hypothetical protein
MVRLLRIALRMDPTETKNLPILQLLPPGKVSFVVYRYGLASSGFLLLAVAKSIWTAFAGINIVKDITHMFGM